MQGRAPFHYKYTLLPVYEIPLWTYDGRKIVLLPQMFLLILVRRYLYIETVPRYRVSRFNLSIDLLHLYITLSRVLFLVDTERFCLRSNL